MMEEKISLCLDLWKLDFERDGKSLVCNFSAQTWSNRSDCQTVQNQFSLHRLAGIEMYQAQAF